MSVHCHGVQSGGLLISKSALVKACMRVSRSCTYKQLHLQKGSTLSFFLSRRQTEINQVLSFPRSCYQECQPRGLSPQSLSGGSGPPCSRVKASPQKNQFTLPLGSATHLGWAPLLPVFRAIWRMKDIYNPRSSCFPENEHRQLRVSPRMHEGLEG